MTTKRIDDGQGEEQAVVVMSITALSGKDRPTTAGTAQMKVTIPPTALPFDIRTGDLAMTRKKGQHNAPENHVR